MANIVLRNTIGDMKSSGCSFYAIISDEYTDISNVEKLTIPSAAGQ